MTTVGPDTFFTAVPPVSNGLHAPKTLPTATDGAGGPPLKLLRDSGQPRDYRTDAQCKSVRARLKAAKAHCHIWKHKELESYLLEPKTISRLSGASEAVVQDALAASANELADEVLAHVTAEALKRYPRDQHVQAVREAKTIFDAAWQDSSHHHLYAPPALVLHGLNRRLAEAGRNPVSFAALARRMALAEVPPEMANFIDRVEAVLDAGGVPSEVS